MSSAALPLALLVVLVELTVGTLWVLLLPQARHNAAASFIKFSAVLVFIMAAITFFVGSFVSVSDSVDGYPMDTFWMLEVGSSLAALFAASGLYAYATYRDHRVAELVIGGIAGVLSNLFFWLRVGLGLGFPAVLGWMAYDSSGVRAMQSATGLLYIAMVLVICGQVVAAGLLFVSAVPN